AAGADRVRGGGRAPRREEARGVGAPLRLLGRARRGGPRGRRELRAPDALRLGGRGVSPTPDEAGRPLVPWEWDAGARERAGAEVNRGSEKENAIMMSQDPD